MKVYEMETGQIFEEYTSKKEVVSMIKDCIMFQEEWEDEDSSLEIEYKDGRSIGLTYGDKINVRFSNISKVIYCNSCTTAFYNAKIVKNERYDDYEVI